MAQAAFVGCNVVVDRDPQLDAFIIKVTGAAGYQVFGYQDGYALQTAKDPRVVVSVLLDDMRKRMALGPQYSSTATATLACSSPVTTTTFTTASNTTAYSSPFVYEWCASDWPGLLDKVAWKDIAGVREIEMKDGSMIHIDKDGNFRVEDAQAKVTYKANRIREFNSCINAGDLLAEFIDYVRREVPGVKRRDIPELPLQLFANWLILEAAERDGEDAPPDIVPVPKDRLLVARVRPRCKLPTCRRFIPKASVGVGFLYCNPDHAAEHGRLLRAA